MGDGLKRVAKLCGGLTVIDGKGNVARYTATGRKRKMTSRQLKAHNAALAQQRWMEDRGGDLAGYVANYGSKGDPEHHGNGGEAIYAADKAELDRLIREAAR